MNRKLCCAALFILAGSTAAAVAGPYSIENGHVVIMGPGYHTATPIGNGPHNVSTIEFSVDGFLYGVNLDTDTLVKIDPATGVSETVGTLGIDLILDDIDLDEDAAGQLWMLDYNPSGPGLYTIDRETGAASLFCEPDNHLLGLASLNGSLWTSAGIPDPPDPGCGLEYIDHNGVFGYDLETGPDGWIHTLWSLSAMWGGGTGYFSRIDPVTGTVDHLGSYHSSHGVRGLTFDPTEQPTPAAIPALGWGGRTLFTLLLALAGAVILTHPSTRRF